MKIRARVVVKGLVQGVNFRRYTQETALRHNVSGWVSNLPDGSVEACLEGEAAAVDAVIAWCRTGPSWGRVDEVIVKKEEYRGEFDGFEVRR